MAKNKNSQRNPEKSPEKYPVLGLNEDSEELLGASAPLSIEEQAIQLQQELFGVDEEDSDTDPNVLEVEGHETEECGVEESGALVASSSSRKKRRQSRKERADMADFGPVSESATSGVNFQSFVTEERLASLRKEFRIPDSVTLRAPGADERPCAVQGDEVAICMDAIYSGLRLPMQPFFRKVFHAMGLAPVQVNPNVFRFLAALFVLFSKLRLGEPSVAELTSIFALKSHPSPGCANKNFGVYYSSQVKDAVIIHGVPTSNKNWRRNWFWAGGRWRADFDPELLSEEEVVCNQVQGKVNWGAVELSDEVKARIRLALTVEEESRMWSRLTDGLALYQANLINTPPEEGFDYPLKFKEGEDVPEELAQEAVELIPEGSETIDEQLLPEGPEITGELKDFVFLLVTFFIISSALCLLTFVCFCRKRQARRAPS